MIARAIARSIARAINEPAGSAFNPLSLFAAGDQGAWYDPSDLSTLFQDTAGTIPVTSAGQPVGLMRDKSGRGNHATQATATSRPILQTAGGKWYLQFDGVDDSMATGSIDMTATNKVTMWAGVFKPSDALGKVLCEFSQDVNANNGSFAFYAPGADGLHNYSGGSRGTVKMFADAITYTAPHTAVLCMIANIGGPRIEMRVNKTPLINTESQGTGNYGNYPLYIGARGGTIAPFGGRLYGLIVLGANGAPVAQTEDWMNGKTGAY